MYATEHQLRAQHADIVLGDIKAAVDREDFTLAAQQMQLLIAMRQADLNELAADVAALQRLRQRYLEQVTNKQAI